ncbi:hypothetical protein [Streptacidiphilus pinicola]|uniref:hypothetical protein n=1 Tax=Streptacidiphilus pinicola TaxID=2219663 RepID=UPI00140258DF|nr:hypothetical protein [Streptacidiphilus pinicola]
MTASLIKLGDKMLARLVPGAAASGGCAPDGQTNYSCNPATGYFDAQYCYYTGACKYVCGAQYRTTWPCM